MIEAIIFDLNGVFIEREFVSDTIEREYGVDSELFMAALKDVMPKVRKPNAPSSYELWKPYLDKWNIKLTEDEFFDFWFSREHVVQELFNYSRELREEGVKVFILSNNFRERTTYYREHFPELFDAVDRAYFSWETGFVKPDERAFKNILEENGLEAENCVYFDDSQRNIDVAKRLRMHAELYKDIETTKKIVEELRK
ncbi:hypothetical protein COV17_04120 [Candidatus Woesearchaeota archaeon CG10_big_fil_rev_8_21_14_0_10_36_11]|nr:MAG: hypothetical protein COV17_04120 [Candidatus Woesearchaeota archaeon CG10_big_fil_rev_8_21_14_0_10_36_11]